MQEKNAPSPVHWGNLQPQTPLKKEDHIHQAIHPSNANAMHQRYPPMFYMKEEKKLSQQLKRKRGEILVQKP
jgi:hypothetical protein